MKRSVWSTAQMLAGAFAVAVTMSVVAPRPPLALAAEDVQAGDADAASVRYLDAEGNEQVAEGCGDFASVADRTALNGGWYALESGELSIPDGLEIEGDVNLIIGDATLTVGGAGIRVTPGATLRIYCMPGCEDKATVAARVAETAPDDYDTHALISNEGCFELVGGRLTRAADDTAFAWRGINCEEGSTTTLYSGEVSGFLAGIFNYEGVLNLYGGTVTGNTFGVQHFGHDTLVAANPGCELHMKGAPVVIGNNAEANPDAGDVCMVQLDQFILDGPLTAGARLGVFRGYDDCPLTQGFAQYNPDTDPSDIFEANRDDHIPARDQSGEARMRHVITYIDEQGNEAAHDYGDLRQTKSGVRKKGVWDYDSSEKTFTTGWYLIGSVDFADRVEVKGDVKFIVSPGVVAKFEKGIRVKSGNSLTIYSAKGERGKVVTGYNRRRDASIGGNECEDAGKIVICGSDVEAKTMVGAAIGAGYGKRKFDIAIHGDSHVEAVASTYYDENQCCEYGAAFGCSTQWVSWDGTLYLDENLRVVYPGSKKLFVAPQSEREEFIRENHFHIRIEPID